MRPPAHMHTTIIGCELYTFRSDSTVGPKTRPVRTPPGPRKFQRSPMYRSTVRPLAHGYGSTKVGCEL